MAPPPLTARSADRMKEAVGLADSLVDSGMAPEAAIAKAARDTGLPVGHVPIVVRAFNTGRAVRQQGAEDPWEKAASHPIASIEGVVALLSGGQPPTAKRASDLTDYIRPPASPQPSPPSWLTAADRELLTVERTAAKQAAEIAPPPVKPRRIDNRIDLEMKAAAAFETAVELAEALTPAQYSAVKFAATKLVPEPALHFFRVVEGSRSTDDGPEPYNGRLLKLASMKASPDPTIRNDHPFVLALRELGAVKAAYSAPSEEAAPEGYEAVEAAGGIRFFRKLAVCPVFGTVLPSVKPAADVTPAPELFQTPSREKLAKVVPGMNPISQGISDYASNREGVSAIGRGFRGVFGTGLAAAFSNPLIGRAVDLAPEDDAKFRGRSVGGLGEDLKRVNFQSAAQSMLADPRFAKADPKTVIDTYRDLSNLAPMAMSNNSIASDFIQRRLATGPLSYWDLEKLTGIEKNLAAARRDANPSDED